MFTSPPPSQWAPGPGSSRPRGPRSTFEASFGRFFGVSIFDWFFDTIFHRFWLPNWSQNGAKIDQKSDFFVDWRCRCFFHVSTCFLRSFLHQLLNLRTLISKRPYGTFSCFFAFQKIASRTTSKLFLTPQKLKKTSQNTLKVVPKARKKQHRKNIWFFYIFLAKIASKWEPKIDEKSIKMGGARWVNRFFKAEVTPKIDFERSKPHFEPPGCNFRSILEPLGAILDQKI